MVARDEQRSCRGRNTGGAGEFRAVYGAGYVGVGHPFKLAIFPVQAPIVTDEDASGLGYNDEGIDMLALHIALPCVRNDTGLWLEFGAEDEDAMRIISAYRQAQRSDGLVYGFDEPGSGETHRSGKRVTRAHGLSSATSSLPIVAYVPDSPVAYAGPPRPASPLVSWAWGPINETLPPFLRGPNGAKPLSFVHMQLATHTEDDELMELPHSGAGTAHGSTVRAIEHRNELADHVLLGLSSRLAPGT